MDPAQDFWWHATCNLLPYTVAVGGQVWAPPASSRSDEGKFEVVPPPPPRDTNDDGKASEGGARYAQRRGLNQYQLESEETAVEGKLLPSTQHDEL